MPTTWMPIYWGAYFKNTFHLTTEEHGAYFLLMGYYWQNGKIPRDIHLIKKITGLSEKKLSRVMKFFTIDGGYYINARLEEEKDKAVEFKRKKSEAGKKGMYRRYNTVSNSVSPVLVTNAQQTPNPLPLPLPVLDDDNNKSFVKISLKVQELMQGRILNTQGIHSWLRAGAGEDLILETIKVCLAKKGGSPPSSLKYFDNAIADALAAKNNQLPKGIYEPITGRNIAIYGSNLESQAGKRSGDKGKSALSLAADRAEKRILERFANKQAENASGRSDNPDAGIKDTSVLLDDTGSVRQES